MTRFPAPRRWSLWALGAPAAAFAQAGVPPEPARLAPVVVTATRTEATGFDLPASIDRVDGADVRAGRARINISESLGAVPGLQARDRQNYAQDVQLSMRGFGARATFGIRGVRLYVDEIPATLPDGQGQITHADLGTVGRIEVLRGPFSALYGNSAGGVVQVFTEDPEGPPRLEFGASGGSDDTYRLGTSATGVVDGLGYVVGASRFITKGYRDHSEADRRLGNAKLTLKPDEASRLTFVANSVALPLAQDPLGLTRAQFEADPRGVAPQALAFDTRKTVEQTQGGIIYERRVAPQHTVRVLAYAGHRGTEQYQSIPVAPQANPLHPGGVISLSRDYSGADVRWTWTTRLGAGPFDLVAGLAYDTLSEHRQGFQNFVGTTLGVQGALRRDEENHASNTDPYLQASWQPAPRWTLNAGVRHSRVRIRSADQYIVGPNPDDSGSADYEATLPVVGVLYEVDERVHLYATAGRGFETPTLNELSYRPDGQTGLNLSLQPATSDSVEAGVKVQTAAWGDLNAAVFQTRTNDEIATLSSVGGRSTFQNVGRTRRTGVELGWSGEWQRHLRAQAAATWLDATYRDSFTTSVDVPAGNRIPGIARGSLYAGVTWLPPTGWRGGVEARYLSSVMVDDANADAAPSYTIASAHGGYVLALGAWELGGTVRVDNLFDRGHIGSVIVNEGNRRFFEPAPGRTWLASLTASVKF